MAFIQIGRMADRMQLDRVPTADERETLQLAMRSYRHCCAPFMGRVPFSRWAVLIRRTYSMASPETAEVVRVIEAHQ